MRKILQVGEVKILVDIQETAQELGKFQFSSYKYDIWCFDDSWEEAKEDLAWILQDKVKAYTSVPYSSMRDKREREKWRLYSKIASCVL